MSLSRKHYEAVADILLDSANDGAEPTYDQHDRAVLSVASRLADYFASDNERFDRGRFLKACGVQA